MNTNAMLAAFGDTASLHTTVDLASQNRFDTEASLLGALLHYGDPISYRLAASIVGPEHFNDAFNARVFSIIGKGFDAQLKAFPLVHFTMSELRDDPTLEELNTSASAIVTEYIVRCAPRIGIEGCARQIRHDHLNDKLKAAVEEGETGQTENLASEMRQLENAHLFKDEGSQAISKSVPAILDRIAELHQNGVMPNTDAYPGSHQLQQLFGGWRRGKFFVLGGRPGMGKSTAALSWLLRTAERGHGVMLFSLEMTLPELTEIALCDLAWSHNRRIEYRDIASTSARAEGLDWKYEALRTASERFTAMPFTIVDKSSLTLADIRAQAIRENQRLEAQGKRLDVIAIDHLGLIKPSGTYAGSKVAETEEISAALKAMAKELGLAVLCLVQLNRGLEGREDKQPSLADLRWSGAIEQDADVVLFVYREGYYLQKEKDDPMEDMARRTKLDDVRNELKLIVAKHRGGPTPTLKFFCDLGCGVVKGFRKMSVKAMTWAFAQPISGNDKVVLLALADFSDDYGTCWPSIGKIAEKAFVSERTVVRIMQGLIKDGYVFSISRNDQNGRQVANKYGLNMGEREGDNLSEGGDTGVRGEGDTVVTPLKRTTIKNRQRDMSVSDETRPSKPKSSKYGDDYETFWKSYPTDPGMSKKEGAKEWQKLTPSERTTATGAVPAFKIWVAKQGKDYRTLHAVRYLSQRRFEGFAGSEDVWAERLAFARNNHEWGIVWGPLPHQSGCLVPPSLLQPSDGLNWKQWKAA